jgi:hypothetical protein
MAKRSTVQPVWLDRMLVQWGIRSLKIEISGLGYPRKCPMLAEGIPTQARSYEPTGYSELDFQQLDTAIAKLDRKYLLVVSRAYKPWYAESAAIELAPYGVTERTWYNWLQDAARMIETSMARDKEMA